MKIVNRRQLRNLRKKHKKKRNFRVMKEMWEKETKMKNNNTTNRQSGNIIVPDP